MAFIMDPYSIDIENIFITHLKKKGIEQVIVGRFVKDLINSKFDDPNTSIYQVTNFLTHLGWEDTVIDYHTLQLAQAYLDNCSTMS